MKNRMISMVLIFCMIITLLPGNIFATETGGDNGIYLASVTTSDGIVENYIDFATALSAAQSSSGSTLKLLSDVSYSETSPIRISNTMTLDLNGRALIMSGMEGYILLPYNNLANLTVQDSSIEGNGKIVSSSDYAIGVFNGTLKITGGTYQSMSESYSSSVIHVEGDNSRVEITGGEFKNDGTGNNIYYNNGSISISGGIFHNNILIYNKNVKLSGGTYRSYIVLRNTANITWKDMLEENYCYYDSYGQSYIPEDYIFQIGETITVDEIDWSKAVTYEDKTKTYTVSSAEGLRWISGVSNDMIEEDTYKKDPALPETCEFTGYTIKLSDNIDLSGQNWIPINNLGGATFDGAGHSIFNMKVVENGSGGLIYYLSSGSTVRNLSVSGTVTVNNEFDGFEPESAMAGGIVARMDAVMSAKTSIENCVANVAVTANGIVFDASLGGLVGCVDATYGNATVSIRNCYSNGTVTNQAEVYNYEKKPYLGTIVGNSMLFEGNVGELVNCYGSQSGLSAVGHNDMEDATAIKPVLTSVGTYDENGILVATDDTNLDYGNDLKTAMKNGVFRHGAEAVNYVTWTEDTIPLLTTTYANVHTHHAEEWTKQENGSYSGNCTECDQVMMAEACVTSQDKETGYETLEQAIAAADIENGSTVKLLTDVTYEHRVTAEAGAFTIDLNGNNWNSNTDTMGLLLKGTSHVTLKDSVGSGEMNGTGSYTIFVQGASFTIESGTYRNTGKGNALDVYRVNAPGRRATIHGGTFISSNAMIERVRFLASNTTITGGTFERYGVLFDSCNDVDITGGTFSYILTNLSEYEPAGTIKTVGEVLAEGYAYSNKSDGTWISDVGVDCVANVIVKKAPVEITDQPQNIAVTYGYTEAPVLSVIAQKDEGVTSEVTYRWYLNQNSTVISTDSACMVETGLGAGTYSYTCEVTCDGYTVSSSTATVTVNQAAGSIMNKDYPENFTYTDKEISNPTAANFTCNIPEGNLVFTWYQGESNDDTHKISGSPKEVGIYTLMVNAQGNENITAAEYTMKVEIKYLEASDVPSVWMKGNYVDKVWYNQFDLEDNVFLNSNRINCLIRHDADDYWYDDMYINEKIKDSNGKIKEGQVEVKYQLRDMNTNQITDFKSYFFNIDVTVPTIDESNIQYSEHQSFLGWLFHNERIQVTVPVSDMVSGADHIIYVLTPEGGTAQEAQTASVGTDGNAVFMVEQDFKGTIAVTAYDKAGNPSETVMINKMFIENTKPTVTVNNGANDFTDQWYTTQQTVNISASDTGSGIKSVTYSVDGGEILPLFEAKEADGSLTATAGGLTMQAIEGEHTYQVTIVDHALNTTTQTVTIKQDTVLPVLSEVAVQSESTPTGTISTVTFTASESGRVYYHCVKKNGSVPSISTVFSQESQVMTAGTQNTISLDDLDLDQEYTLYLAAKDMAGNKMTQAIPFDFKTAKMSFATAVVTLADSSFVYNGTSQIPNVVVSIEGMALPDSMYDISYSNSNGGEGNTTNAGNITVTVTASEDGMLTGTSNSKPTYEIKKGTINSDEVDVTCYSGTYDGAAHNAVTSVTGIPEGTVIFYSNSTDNGATWSEYRSDCPQITNTGSLLIKMMMTNENYENCEIGPKTATVGKKSVTVTAFDYTRKYGENNPSFTLNPLSEDLLVGTDTIDDLKVTLSTSAMETSDAGMYQITGTSLSNNYDVAVEEGTLTVEQSDSSITIAEGKDKITKIFGDAAFLSECSKTGEGTLTYTVSESKDAVGKEVANNQVISVDSVGNITIHRAGSAIIRVGMAATKNYKEAVTKTIAVTIRKADVAPGMPATTVKTAFNSTKISDVTLPDGWAWKDTDQNKALEVDVPIGATAVYHGSDHGNYEKESVEIFITRSSISIETYLVTGLQASYSYTGSEIKPTVSLSSGDTQVVTNYYQIRYQNNTNVGTATIIITGINGYTGTITKTFEITKINATLTVPEPNITKTFGESTFSLNAKPEGTAVISYETDNPSIATVSSKGEVTMVGYGIVTITITTKGPNYNAVTKNVSITVKPKTMAKAKVKGLKNKKINVSWKKDNLATGYQIRYATNKKFTSKTTKSVTVRKKSVISKKISRLKSGKNYYVQVRAYKKSGTSYIYSSWSSTRGVKVK